MFNKDLLQLLFVISCGNFFFHFCICKADLIIIKFFSFFVTGSLSSLIKFLVCHPVFFFLILFCFVFSLCCFVFFFYILILVLSFNFILFFQFRYKKKLDIKEKIHGFKFLSLYLSASIFNCFVAPSFSILFCSQVDDCISIFNFCAFLRAIFSNHLALWR